MLIAVNTRLRRRRDWTGDHWFVRTYAYCRMPTAFTCFEKQLTGIAVVEVIHE